MSYSKKFRGFIQSMTGNSATIPQGVVLRGKRNRQSQLMELLETRQLLSGSPVITDVNFTPNPNHGTPTSLTASEFLSSDATENTDPLTSVTVTVLPTNGVLTLTSVSGNVTTHNPVTAGEVFQISDLDSLVYTPNVTFEGGDAFTWTASDGTNSSNAAHFNFVVADNFAPVITGISKDMLPSTIATPTTLNFSSSDFTSHFTDDDAGDALQSVTILSSPSHGTLRLNGVIVNPGLLGQVIPADQLSLLTYTPSAGFAKGDGFTWTASDGVQSSNASSVSINVGSLAVAGTSSTNVLTTIASGDTSPSQADSTDFGFNSTNAARPLVTRTFTITNNSANTVNLTGAKLVSVSGGNASDFIVTQPSVSSLAAGASTTFTITFKPSGSGLRKTTVTIASSLVGETPYTFSIQGTGVSVTTAAGNLEFGTVVKGTGKVAAVANDSVTISFSGVLVDGTPLDPHDINASGDPSSFQLILGLTDVPAGLTTGVTGMKAGETRVLFIPGALAFGVNGTSDVPPNATVIYTVTAKEIDTPVLVVTGNASIPIPFGDKTPSLADGTNLGGLNSGAGTLTSTFHLSDGGAGVLSNPTVTITGGLPAVSGWSISPLTLNPDGPSTDFTISYAPPVGTTEGLKTQTVTIHTNDPLHPLYTFNVQATFVTNVDLVPTLKTTNFPPATITSGSGKGVMLPVVITNTGSHPVPGGLTTEIQVWAHDTVGGGDTLVQTYSAQNVGGIAANGGTKTFNLNVVPPLGFASADAPTTYTLFAKINTNNSIPETDTTDNSSPKSIQTITVIQGHVDIQGNLVSTTLLPQLATGTSNTGNVVIALNNVGNLNLPSNQKVNVSINLHNTTSGIDTLLNNQPFVTSVGNLGEAAKTFSYKVTVPGTLSDGTYNITVTVTPVAPLVTDDPSNNVLSTTAAASPLQVTVAPAFTNVGGALVSSKLSSGLLGQTITGSVQVTVRNTGNQKFSSAQQATLQIFARDINDNSDNGTAISVPVTISLKNFTPNQSGTFNVNVSLLGGLPAGTYDIEALVTPTLPFTQTTPADEHLQLTAAGDPIVFKSAVATNNITASNLSVPTSLTNTHAATTQVSGTIKMTLTNNGNVPLPSNEIVTVVFSAVDPLNSANTKVIGQIVVVVSNGKVNQSLNISKSITIPASFLTASAYEIQAVATATNTVTLATLTESNLADNTLTTAPGTMTVT